MHSASESAVRLGYANRTITKPPDWHGLVAWDMLVNNLTTGLFLVAGLGELAAPTNFSAVASAAYPIALALLLADLLLLTLDLGDWTRFHHMLRVVKPGSPMSMGTWSLTVYSLPLTAIVAVELLALWLPSDSAVSVLSWVRKVAILLGMVPALAVAVYKGVLLSTTAQPAWKGARWLGGYLANSALLLGCAVLLALAALLHQARACDILRSALVLLLLLNSIPLCLLIANLWPALARFYTRQKRWQLGCIVLGGSFVPLGLLLASGAPIIVLSAVALLLCTSAVSRFVIIGFPHVCNL